MKTTIYELLGLSKNSENETYVKYHNRLTEQDEVMWSCKENIIYKLYNNIIYLDDEVEILDEPKEDKIEKVDTYVLCDSDFHTRYKDGYSLKATEIIDKAFEEYSYKINELIDEVNKLKEK